MKLAYADVKAYDGDPRFGSIPVKQLLSKEFAAKRAALIDPDKANCDVAPGALAGSDTTYLSVVDREGNILSLIQSNYESFGSDVTVKGMGFALQDRGGLFSVDRKSPNALAGHKRPFHTIIPAFMEHGDQHIGFGIMGGMNQPLAHAQFVSNVVDYHMNIQAAMEEARFTVSTKLGCNIVIESRVPADSLAKLRDMGHVLDVRKSTRPRWGAARRCSTTAAPASTMGLGAASGWRGRAEMPSSVDQSNSSHWSAKLSKSASRRCGSSAQIAILAECAPLRSVSHPQTSEAEVLARTFCTHQMVQRLTGAIGWPVLQANAFWNSGRFRTTPLARNSSGEWASVCMRSRRFSGRLFWHQFCP